ncbi:histidine kinase [Streptomyces sp. NRRL S-87]|uniref:sensor histidine kinase n=1 Tax=Streptomyces sp. NRRL S-87 TaxID=1463920 RepID=UPI0004C0136D|nr:histidine kinase [Streptomyces sp. NRRL S-87]
MDVKSKLRDARTWLKGPEPWSRRRTAGECVLAGVLVLLAAGLEDLTGSSWQRQLVVAAGVALLSLLRRRLPAAVLVVSAALGAFVVGMGPVTIVAGWSAGRRIVGAGRALAAFTLAYVLGVAIAIVDGWSEQRPLLLVLFSTLLYLATVVIPGLTSRYWTQRRTLLHALQERNVQLLREREMVAGQARLRERQRIAQDMHDSLGHQLALISVHTGALEVDPALTDRQREAVGVLRGASVAAMHELREVVGILRDGVEAPPQDEVQAAARGVAGIAGVVEAARAAGTDVALTSSGAARPLASACDHAAYRIVQEALTNAYKHAPGAAITVELRYEDDSLVVEIANGPAAGPTRGEVVSGGQGLTGLRERARLVGGMVHAGATEDGGFRVAGVLPYGTEQAGAYAADAVGVRDPWVVRPGVVAGAADDFGQQASGMLATRAPMDWAAVDRELGRRGRFRTVALGCGIVVAALVLLVVAAVVSMMFLMGSVSKGMADRETYDSVRVGEAESDVRARLPSGDTVLTSGLGKGGPPRPAGASCLVLMSSEDAGGLTDAEPVFRFCFKDGKLIEKQSYEVKR